LEKNGIPAVTLVTKVFEALGKTVAKGRGYNDLEIHVMPHPLNPLPEEKVRSITREHVQGIIDQLLALQETHQ
jgi:hypothetical protein